MSNYDVAIGGVKDDGTSYLQVGRNNKTLNYLKIKEKNREFDITFYVTHVTFFV